jgi:hypothetical protein
MMGFAPQTSTSEGILEADTLILSRVVERTHEELGIIEIEHHYQGSFMY